MLWAGLKAVAVAVAVRLLRRMGVVFGAYLALMPIVVAIGTQF